ncbi:MAG: double-strand break repair protein AddB, partial [Micropepsaceae bacterium]
MARAINLFTIPPGAAFADELARGVLKRFSSDDPFALSRALILVPTQRSIDTIREAFARVAPGGVAVLPRIWALGEFDDAPLLDDEGEDVVRELGADLPPPLSRFRRELLLTRFVLRWLTQQEHERALGNVTPGQALELARDLAKLLDEATQEGLAWERLQTIVPHELSEHWERTLKFLGILTKEWPGLLDAENSLDPVAYRVAALRRTAARWREVPPEFPVIAAGSTGSLPATADLLRTIAYMPSGAVVLPGIDLGLDRKAWDAVEAGHPQHGMHQLLTRMDATRSDVQAWTDCASNSARARLLAEALRPAESTPSWRDLVQERKTEVELGLQGLSLVVARTPAEEALIIALALREAVETPNKTAALVTRDRTLARRVAGELKRWGIAIDDSAGVPLSQTLPGRFLQLIADVTAQEFAPVPLLALLKHPFSALGFETTAEVRLCTLDLEEMVLRGPRPASGIDGLKSVVHPTSPVAKLITQLDLACGGFAAAMTGEALDLRRFAQLHREAAELLSAVATTIELKLWEGDAGAAAFKLFERLMSADADVGLTMRGDDYAAFFRAVMDAPEAPVQPRGGQHPRLAILGTLEVRLQHADLMILGGLNEGVWPPATDPGPWLNRPMRRELDVSQPE